MNTEQFTTSVRKAFGSAQTIALRRHHQRLCTLHLLSALLEDDQQTTSSILMRSGVNLDQLKTHLKTELDKIPQVTGSGAENMQIDPKLGRLVGEAESWSKQRGDSFISVDALLMAMTGSASPAAKLLTEAGLKPDDLAKTIDEMRKGRTIDSDVGDQMMDSLAKYATDLTALAMQGKLDPVIGRDEEVRRAIQILARRTKKQSSFDWCAWCRKNCHC
jgi:ATP-dependent Clp protease ATP-binding subunit ClpB